jgi:hypothetical protein
MKNGNFVRALLSLFSVLFALTGSAAEKLPGLDIDLKQTSVSGLSSGAFMASQFYMVHSDIMIGAGIVAGGPYLCAQSWVFQDYLTNATTACMSPLSERFGPNTPHLVTLTQQLAAVGKIDSLENIRDDRLYIFSGKADRTVKPSVVRQTREYFLSLDVPQESILFRDDVVAGHALLTSFDQDVRCPDTRAPFINNCNFMQSYEIIRHIYGELNPPAASLSGDIIKFNQKEFIRDRNTSMSDEAYVYVPAICHTERCRLHVAFHGCEQGAKLIRDKYYAGTGYNYIADTNRLVVLYPQAEPSKRKPYNPKGCWDFWGYSAPNQANPDYFTRDAPQIKAIKAMVDRLAESRASAIY